MQPEEGGKPKVIKPIKQIVDDLTLEMKEAKKLIKESKRITWYFVIFLGVTILGILVALVSMYVDSHRQMMQAYRESEKASQETAKIIMEANHRMDMLMIKNPRLIK